MDLTRKQNNTIFLMNIFQIIVSVTAFIVITYVIVNLTQIKELLIYLSLDIIITGFVINGVKTFINDIKTSH